MFTTWATNVNKIILDSTSITVGNGATITDNLENGLKRRRVACSTPPDSYKVVMSFECDEKGTDGYTELERFYKWYKYTHRYGTNPFLFPAILINSNRQIGMSREEYESILTRIANHDPTAHLPDEEYYIITSAIEGSKSGSHLQISMTWETYATNEFTITTDYPVIDHIEPHNGYVDIVMTKTPEVEPTKNSYTLKIDNADKTVTACYFDGDRTIRYYFEALTTPGTHTATVLDKTERFTV